MDRTRIQRTAMVVKVALIASIGVYGAVAFVVARRGPLGQPPTPDVLRLMAFALGAFAVVLLVTAHLLPRLLLARLAASEQSRRRAAELGPEAAAAAVAFSVQVVQVALSESVAIFGLVLTLLSGDLTWFVGFGAAAVISMAACRLPLEAALEATMRA